MLRVGGAEGRFGVTRIERYGGNPPDEAEVKATKQN